MEPFATAVHDAREMWLAVEKDHDTLATYERGGFTITLSYCGDCSEMHAILYDGGFISGMWSPTNVEEFARVIDGLTVAREGRRNWRNTNA